MAENQDSTDRRQNPRLRQVFDEVYESIAPFFDPKNSWGSKPLDHLAFRVVRQNYPDLSQDEVHQLVSAAARVYANGGSRTTPSA